MGRKISKEERSGLRNYNSRNEWFEIIEYNNAMNMSVRFDVGEIAYNITYSDFKKGTVRLPSEKNERHGDRYTKLWKEWNTMKWRCNPKNKRHHVWYSDKGIKVCDEWNLYSNFKKWALDNGFEESLTIDRINHTKNYCPDNCRWITNKENISDSTLKPVSQFTLYNVYINSFPSIAEASRKTNVPYYEIQKNLKGKEYKEKLFVWKYE